MALDQRGDRRLLHSDVRVPERIPQMLGDFGVVQLPQDDTRIAHHVPALVGHPLSRRPEPHRAHLRQEAQQEHAVRGRFLGEPAERLLSACHPQPLQQLQGRLGQSGVAPLLHVEVDQLRCGLGREQARERLSAALRMLMRIPCKRLLQRGARAVDRFEIPVGQEQLHHIGEAPAQEGMGFPGEELCHPAACSRGGRLCWRQTRESAARP